MNVFRFTCLTKTPSTLSGDFTITHIVYVIRQCVPRYVRRWSHAKMFDFVYIIFSRPSFDNISRDEEFRRRYTHHRDGKKKCNNNNK